MILLGWLDKLGGILFYTVLYVSIYSIVLFYGSQAKIIPRQAIENSSIYSLVAPFGPAIIRFITAFIPFGKDMFTALEVFFEKISANLK